LSPCEKITILLISGLQGLGKGLGFGRAFVPGFVQRLGKAASA